MVIQERIEKQNEIIHKRVEIVPIEDKLMKKWLRWFGHMQLSYRDASVQRSDLIHVEGKWGKGKQKIIWEEVIKKCLKSLHLIKNMTQNQAE